MRALILLFFLFIIGINSVQAYELVLPKEKKTIVSTDYAFFVGKANKAESIIINDDKVYIASNGAFAHTVKLKEGENRVVVKSDFATQIYRFYKTPSVQSVKPEVVDLVPQLYQVVRDNTPLRATPVDYGMNRLSHLFAGTNILIDGKKGDFYRVFLTKNKSAWIAKDSVRLAKEEVEPKFITMNSETFKNASKHVIEFTEKLPYTIEETEKEIIFKVYNSMVPEGTVYTVNIRKPEKYTYETNLYNGVYVFKVSEFPLLEKPTLEGLTVVVDAGHGGSEKGAIGCLGDNEKDINLKIAMELKEILSQMGAEVVLTRECDANVSLEDRVNIARENCANVFVSIHLNSIPDVKFDVHKNRGTSVYYYNNNSRDLAKNVQKTLIEYLDTRNDGIKSASFAVLRPTDYIGILVEVAYMTNPIDSLLYSKEDFPRETAKSIAEGLLNFAYTESDSE